MLTNNNTNDRTTPAIPQHTKGLNLLTAPDKVVAILISNATINKIFIGVKKALMPNTTTIAPNKLQI